MALFFMILRKMRKNLLLETALLVGLILTVALTAAIPVYTHSTLDRMLVKELDRYQTDNDAYAGSYVWTAYFRNSKPEQAAAKLAQADAYFDQSIPDRFPMDSLETAKLRYSKNVSFTPVDTAKVDSRINREGRLSALSGLEQHIKLVDGRMPEAAVSADGTVEALVTDRALSSLKMVLGNEFYVMSDNRQVLKIKPVGVFTVKDEHDLYWFQSLDSMRASFVLPYEAFEREITNGGKIPVLGMSWFHAFDYRSLKMGDLETLKQADEESRNYVASHFEYSSFENPMMKIVDTYEAKEARLRLMLWALNAPVLVLFAFYLFMVAGLITERQKNEISVLRSRGAARWQILAASLAESLLLGVLALLAGLPGSLLLTRVLGASSGFLVFVSRAPLYPSLNADALLYAALAVLCSVVMTLLPVWQATRSSIVARKQQLSRVRSVTFLHKYFIDLLLIGFALYGLQNYQRRMKDLTAHALDSLSFKVDPLLFLLPACFIIGFTLLLLRLYPYLLRLLYRLGKRFWSPSLYSTLIQVGRSATQYQTIMVFLSLTLATGLFSASAARTLNANAEEQIRYRYGADVSMSVAWSNDAPVAVPTLAQSGKAVSATPVDSDKRVTYIEPPFEPVRQLPEVDAAAKVFIEDEGRVTVNGKPADSAIMGIDTDDFGRVAWMRDGLLDHSFYAYLNLIAPEPTAVLISRSLADDLKVKVGDHIQIGWEGIQQAETIVFGIVDYWPSWNPLPVSKDRASGTAEASASAGEAGEATKPYLVVGHLSFIQNHLERKPYEYWLKLKPGALVQELYQSIESADLSVNRIDVSRQVITERKNDPAQLAINGMMTMGFLISMLLTLIGFLLYWLLSIAGRMLQFGIYRALGITFRQLVGMLIAEQALTSAAAVCMGVGAGMVTSRLFVPLFRISFSAAEQVPPFHVIVERGDLLRLYGIAALTILIGLAALGGLLSRMKLHQAVKLGED